MEKSLAHQVAIVTGGSRGIGAAICRHFAQMGAEVAVVYQSQSSAAEQVCAEIAAAGGKARAYACDVADFEQTAALVEQVLADFGQIDILVNNAGVVRDRMIGKMTEQDFDLVVDTSLKGAFNLARHTNPYFRAQKHGRIINITSVSGIKGNAGQTNYSAAKAGMIGLTKALARELAAKNVTCNAIAPGFIETDMTGSMPEEARAASLAKIPLQRAAQPEEVAYLAGFLASEQAGYITGEVIRIDGGLAI